MASDEGHAVQKALSRNRSWAERIANQDDSYFKKLASGQQPEILWIGCSDSRVPETTILDLGPGEVFVHRNIANLVLASDLSSQCVIEFAVKHLKVKHVVLCGHTSCGGVKGALGDQSLGLLEVWLHDLRALRQQHLSELDKLQSEDEKITRLVELNVQRGVNIIKANPNVIAAIRDRGLQVHGVVFDIEKGQLREVDCSEDEEQQKQRKAVFEHKS